MRAPVARVPLEREAPARIELLHHERPGADGPGQELLAVPRRALGDHPVVLAAHVDEEGGEWPAEREPDRVLADDVDRLDGEEVVGARAHLRVADPVVGVLDVLRVHLLAVVEADPLAEVEDVLGRRLLLPALGQLRLRLEGGVDPHEVLVDQGLPLLPDVEPLHVGLEVRRERRGREGQRPARLPLGRGAPRAHARRPHQSRSPATRQERPPAQLPVAHEYASVSP